MARTPKKEVVKDRSLYNCETCKGEGLIGDPEGEHKICDNCKGTGKING